MLNSKMESASNVPQDSILPMENVHNSILYVKPAIHPMELVQVVTQDTPTLEEIV